MRVLRATRWIWVVSALGSSLAWAEPPDARQPAEAPPVRIVPPARGLWSGDEYRYPRYGLISGLVIRTGMDLVSIPTGIVGWSGSDWAAFAGGVGTSVALMVPIDGRSLDVRIEDAISDPLEGHRLIWTQRGNVIVWSSIAGLTAGLLLYGLLSDHPELVEVAVLMTESFAVAQLFHLALKFVTGRQGPDDGDGHGAFGGPPFFFKYFPSGIPSGHAATIAAMFTAFITYFDHPVLSVALGALGLALSAATILDSRHFVSDVVVGVGLGFGVARWVVHHRSSRFRSESSGSGLSSLVVSPLVLDRGGMGVAASIAW